LIYNQVMMENKDIDKWIVQLRKGVFELAILSLISQRPMYGYEITNDLKRVPIFHLADGAIYPILKRLSKQGWVLSYWEDSEEGPKRKYYQITQEGERILKQRWQHYEQLYDVLRSMVEGSIE
jgi:PadR family transcriptional regulator PadR